MVSDEDVGPRTRDPASIIKGLECSDSAVLTTERIHNSGSVPELLYRTISRIHGRLDGWTASYTEMRRTQRGGEYLEHAHSLHR
jgi:hypothetical protein